MPGVFKIAIIVCLCGSILAGCSRREQQASSHAAKIATVPDSSRKEILLEIQDSKLLYKEGKYDKAESILLKVLKADPANKAARYYLDLTKEARYAEKMRKLNDVQPIPNAPVSFRPSSTSDGQPHTVQGRQRIMAVLTGIRLTEVSYDLPLSEVVNRLRVESQKRDPAGTGVNFMIVGDLNNVVIKIDPPLRDLRYIDLLDAITKVADKPIKFTVEDYAVVFSRG